MKLVLTVTAVFNFDDDVSLTDVEDSDSSFGQHIVYKGHKLQPVIDFLEYEGVVDDTHSWEVPDENLNDQLYDCLQSEDYTIIDIEDKKSESEEEL